MRFLIIGGSGLIGRELATRLALGSNEVIILSRRPEQVVGLPSGVVARPWDGHTAEGWVPMADGADAIINLAGENIGSGRWTKERKSLILESRLNAGRAIVEAVEKAPRKPDVVVQASGVGYYGPHGNEEITEESPPGNDFLSRLAVAWEASTAPVEMLGVRRVVIRTGVVLSASGGALPRMVLPFRLFAGGRLGSGRQWLPWIHITDEARAIRFLVERKHARGAFNLAAPIPITNAEFSQLLAQILKRPAVFPVPAALLRAAFGEMATVILEGQRAVPQRLLQLGFSFRFTDARSALKDLL